MELEITAENQREARNERGNRYIIEPNMEWAKCTHTTMGVFQEKKMQNLKKLKRLP